MYSVDITHEYSTVQVPNEKTSSDMPSNSVCTTFDRGADTNIFLVVTANISTTKNIDSNLPGPNLHLQL